MALASMYGHLDLVELLIDVGADVNKQNESGNTPMIVAAMNGHWDLVELLINLGADMNISSKSGWTALCWAAFDGTVDAVRVLLDGGANVNASNTVRPLSKFQISNFPRFPPFALPGFLAFILVVCFQFIFMFFFLEWMDCHVLGIAQRTQ
eukprot:c27948_g1_i1.p1 GENE.c27948_g1_i1~~c27948_g1_i1.p1  ORF type:complete len:151 (-),score=27.00 c27948_g1_i1:283-735(-)